MEIVYKNTPELISHHVYYNFNISGAIRPLFDIAGETVAIPLSSSLCHKMSL